MFNPNFDPYQVLQDLANNQEILQANDRAISQSVNNLLQRLNEQQQIIDRLVKQIESTNKANEILLESFIKEMNKSLKDIKWPNQ